MRQTQPQAGEPAQFPTHAVSGPYALSVRDSLNELVIGAQLAQHGVNIASMSQSNNSNASSDIARAVPTQMPADGYISSTFGYRHSPFGNGAPVEHHGGVDFAVSYGDPVSATADGIVVYSGWFHGLGKMVAIDHGYGIVTRYGHNSKLEVQVGEQVHRGEVIAKAGNTGHSTGVHVHYEVWIKGQAINPAQFFFEAPSGGEAKLASSQHFSFSHVGLAMGGESGDAAAFGRAHAAMPTAAERLPVNLAITGGFFLLALLLLGCLLPSRRE